MVAALALLVAGLVFLPTSASAQINGAPPSVTSTNFGGHFNSTPGIPPSVTSIGPKGLQPGNQFVPITPLFPVNPNPPLFQKGHHRRSNAFFPGGGVVYVPYPVDGEYQADDPQAAPNPPDDERGGPTIFDRRGSGQAAPNAYMEGYPRPRRTQPEAESAPPVEPAQEPVADQPQTVLIFKNGHQAEVQNYAVVGSFLYDLTPGHHRKIPIADLDVNATAKQNDDLGISFQLPPEIDQQDVNNVNK